MCAMLNTADSANRRHIKKINYTGEYPEGTRDKVKSMINSKNRKASNATVNVNEVNITTVEIKDIKDIFNENPDIITCDNIDHLAKVVAITALTTIHKNSGNDMVWDMLTSIFFEDTSREGLDIVTALKVVLYQLVGKDLWHDYVPNNKVIDDGNGYTLLAKSKKDGKPLTIWRSCLRFVNTIVFTNKKELLKTRHIEDMVGNGDEPAYIDIPKGYDIDSADELYWYEYACDVLQLNKLQKRILDKRMWQGCSITDTAKKCGVSKQNTHKQLAKIKQAYTELYDSIVPYDLDSMPTPPTIK